MSVSYSPAAWRIFELGSRMWRPGRLDGVHLAGLPLSLDRGSPLLVVANHTSWWDGFLVREIHRALRPADPFHTVMLEEELQRHPFLRRLGGIGLTRGSTSSLRGLLRTLARLREESPGALVLFFPQGRLWPGHRRPLGFLPGVRAIRRSLGDATVLPLGIHLSPGATSGQQAWLSAGPPVEAGDPAGSDVEQLEGLVQGELDSILAFLALHGEEAARRWPGPAHPLPRPTDGGGFHPEPLGIRGHAPTLPFPDQ
jgi:1-acyl-sn-glycerol-3-phosphate acyltransferase